MNNGRLHVLTLTPFYPSLGDDVSGCFVAEVIARLRGMGVDCSVIAAHPAYRKKKLPHPSFPARWVRSPQLPGNNGLTTAGRWLFARLRREVSALHLSHPIDVIHAHSALPCGHAAWLLSKHLGIPFVVTLHGLDVFNACFQGGSPALKRRKASIDVYRATPTVVCVSRKVEELLHDGMAEKISSTVVYNGPDTDLFQPAAGDDPQSPEILVVGNLIPIKGHEIVLRAISRLSSPFPHLRCRIIGHGPELSRLQALAQNLGIAARIQFDGSKSRAEVAAAMRACSVFVLPSRYEALGCVYLEAMACGKPVIACRGQGIEEIIEHRKNGWLICNWQTPADTIGDEAVRELGEALSTLLSSAELRLSLGQSARDRIVRDLTLTSPAGCLLAIYKNASA